MAAFFVPESKGQSKSNPETERLEIRLLALGKRVGLSFAEINELRSVDLIDLVRCYSGAEDDGPREATQDDIDKFYGG